MSLKAKPIAMPPMPNWYDGRDAVASFLRRAPLAPGRRWRVVATSASGQPAFGLYRWSDEAGAFVAHDIVVLTLDTAGRIAELIAFLEPEAFAGFGLPLEYGRAA